MTPAKFEALWQELGCSLCGLNQLLQGDIVEIRRWQLGITPVPAWAVKRLLHVHSLFAEKATVLLDQKLPSMSQNNALSLLELGVPFYDTADFHSKKYALAKQNLAWFAGDDKLYNAYVQYIAARLRHLGYTVLTSTRREQYRPLSEQERSVLTQQFTTAAWRKETNTAWPANKDLAVADVEAWDFFPI